MEDSESWIEAIQGVDCKSFTILISAAERSAYAANELRNRCRASKFGEVSGLQEIGVVIL